MSYPPPPGPPQQPYGYPVGPPPVSAGPVRLRGRTPRLLGWIFLALAIVLFVVGGVIAATKSLSKVNGFQRVTVASGAGTVNLDGTGKWIIYFETSQVSNSTSELPPIRIVQLTDPSGQPIVGQAYGNRSDGKVEKFTYDYDGHKGIAAWQFTAPATGTYRIQIQAAGALPSGADIAIGRDISGGAIAGGILILVGVLALIAAIVLLIVGFVKRGRHKRELQAPAYYAGPPGGAGPPYYPPAPYNPPPPYNPNPGPPPSNWNPPTG